MFMIEHHIKCTAAILLLSFTLSAAFPFEIAAAAQEKPVQEASGYLMLITRHVGLQIKIDNRPVGVTSGGVFKLKEGLHKVHIEHPDHTNWFEEDWVADVQILANDTLRVPVIFKRSYSINSQPYGAAVSLDGAAMGETPIFFKLAEDEIKQVTLSKAGFRDTTFTIGQSEQRFFNIELTAAKMPITLSLESASKDKIGSRSKVILYSTAALALVSGGVALYFRNRGNDRYDSYLKTGDPRLMEKYYNDARRFDRLAAVSFGVFQISFVASFYLFLKEANKGKPPAQ